MRFLFTLLLTVFCFLHTDAQCEYKLVIKDSESDGWDIGLLTYTVNGTAYNEGLNNFTDDGALKSITIPVSTGTVLTFSMQQSLFNDEVTVELYDGNDQLLISENNPDAGLFYTHTVACPSCTKVTGLFMENIYATTAKARWVPVGNAQKYRIVYGLGNFATGQGDTLFSTTPKVTIPGLTERTDYTFYVTTICPANDTSLTSGPYSFKTYWSDDLAVTGIDLDVSNCALGSAIPAFKLTNFGANPQTLFEYKYRVNGTDAGVTPPMDGLYAGVIGKDSTATILFETPYDFTASGEYEVCVDVRFLGTVIDDDTTNNTFCKRINNALELPYSQGFEIWDGGWQATAADTVNSWQHGRPNATFINKAASGEKAWVTNLTGNYSPSETSYLTSPCFNLSALGAGEAPAFYCNAIYDLESTYDFVRFEMSIDGGSTWLQQGAIGQGLNWYNELDTLSGLAGWSGNSDGWLPIRQLLNGAQGKSSVMVRFAFKSDPAVSREGFGIDNVQISVPKTNDLAAVGVTTAGDETDCGLATDSVIVFVSNFGLVPQNSYTITYSINGGAAVTQNINQPIAPNQVRRIAFATPFNSVSGSYNIGVTVNLTGDQVATNDSYSYSVNHTPASLPYVEKFENGNPPGWDIEPGGYITDAHGNITNVLTYNLFSQDTSFTYETTVYGPITPGDSLTYQYRVVDFLNEVPIPLAANNLRVNVSTDCGTTWTTVDIVNGTNHTPSNLMTQRSVDLSPYAGDAVKVQFVGKWKSGDFYFDLDHIGFRAKDVSITETDLFGTVRAYPNPTTGAVTIEGETAGATSLEFTVYHFTGAQVLRQEAAVGQQFQQSLDLSGQAAGMYFVRISDGRSQHTIKVIKSAE